MPKSTKHYTVQRTGEYLVAAELSRRGFISTTFSGNAPSFDIVAVKEEKTIPIQVKTTSDASFPSDLIEVSTNSNGEQYTSKKPLDTPDLIYVLVKLKGHPKEYIEDKFYICTQKEVQDAEFEAHESWLIDHNRKRPFKPNSQVTRVGIEDFNKYEGRWEIIC